MTMNEQQRQLCEHSTVDYSDLSALFLNCTLKPSPELSHTEGLIAMSQAIMEANDVKTEVIRPVDLQIATGVYPNMTEHGADVDEWPSVFDKIIAADILVIGASIWLGEKSSVATKVIERIYSHHGQINAAGQVPYYGRVAGSLITGNEDGAKHASMNILWSLQHLGFTIPPQADAAWLGEVGPGPSYLDEGSGGPENDFTNKNTTMMSWNLLHAARMIKDAGGFPTHGNRPKEWEDGCSLDFPNPEYR